MLPTLDFKIYVATIALQLAIIDTNNCLECLYLCELDTNTI